MNKVLKERTKVTDTMDFRSLLHRKVTPVVESIEYYTHTNSYDCDLDEIELDNRVSIYGAPSLT